MNNIPFDRPEAFHSPFPSHQGHSETATGVGERTSPSRMAEQGLELVSFPAVPVLEVVEATSVSAGSVEWLKSQR